MPCAPASRNCSMMFQKSFSFNTMRTLLQPGSANGNTVGLFMPGRSEIMDANFSLGAFNKMYLWFLAFFTERMRNYNFSRMASFSGVSCVFLMSTA